MKYVMYIAPNIKIIIDIRILSPLRINVSANNGEEVGEYKHSVIVVCLLLFVKLKVKVPVILQPV